jgi:hypothetical protein
MKPQIVSAGSGRIFNQRQELFVHWWCRCRPRRTGSAYCFTGRTVSKTNHPTQLTTIHPCGIGDNDQRGMNYLALEGLIDTNIGGFWGNSPKLLGLAKSNKIKGYNFPQGFWNIWYGLPQVQKMACSPKQVCTLCRSALRRRKNQQHHH